MALHISLLAFVADALLIIGVPNGPLLFSSCRSLFCARISRYIFENKELKRAESKGKKDKDDKGDDVPEQKTVARLQRVLRRDCAD
ncbi:hypothetical protein VNO80_00505 [Phaseolus coccineus]|uniref:Uncharacterized protein n=1 Tax=Phaseolus coccineus TaxID=3886 RepID=A0AAN9RR87_PHACN